MSEVSLLKMIEEGEVEGQWLAVRDMMLGNWMALDTGKSCFFSLIGLNFGLDSFSLNQLHIGIH